MTLTKNYFWTSFRHKNFNISSKVFYCCTHESYILKTYKCKVYLVAHSITNYHDLLELDLCHFSFCILHFSAKCTFLPLKPHNYTQRYHGNTNECTYQNKNHYQAIVLISPVCPKCGVFA